MGQVCIASEENERRILELENLLTDQEAEKQALQQKLQQEKERHRELVGDDENVEEVSAQKIETLTNEKKNIFKQMLKEKKNVTKLEDSIEEYKDKIAEMEKEIKEIKDRKRKARIARLAKRANSTATKPPKKTVKEKISALKVPKGTSSNYKSESDGATSSYDDGDDGDEDTEDEGVASDEEEQPRIEQKTTLILDVNFDPQTEAGHIYSWIHDQKVTPRNKAAVKQLKHRLASVLTARSELYRQQLVQAYFERYGIYLEKDIKAAIGKGSSMQIMFALLLTRAQYDSLLISESVANWDILPIADIICCRSLEQMKELNEAYKKKLKLSVKKQLQALAQHHKKKTLVKVIGKMFDFHRDVPKEVNMQKVNEDLNFVLTTKNFKGDNKERLLLIFTTNTVAYIKVFHSQFKLKSKDSLTVFIDKKLGPKSAAGHFCKTRIEYALDTPDYYAKILKKLGSQFQKNKKKIADIFVQRLETDLDLIKRQWEIKKYGDGKTLAQWIETKTHGSKFGHFLTKMLQNCDRYGKFRKTEGAGAKQSKFEKLMM